MIANQNTIQFPVARGLTRFCLPGQLKFLVRFATAACSPRVRITEHAAPTASYPFYEQIKNVFSTRIKMIARCAVYRGGPLAKKRRKKKNVAFTRDCNRVYYADKLDFRAIVSQRLRSPHIFAGTAGSFFFPLFFFYFLPPYPEQ